jgi:hypothetical protein
VSERPQRMYQVTIEVGADSWEDTAAEIRRVLEHVEEHGPECSLVSGGYSSGSHVTVRHDPAMSHDAYFAALDQYLNASNPHPAP